LAVKPFPGLRLKQSRKFFYSIRLPGRNYLQWGGRFVLAFDNDGVDKLLAEGAGDGDAVVSVADEVEVTNFDQFNRGQGLASQPGDGDAHPATAGSFAQRAEVTVEIMAAAFAAANAVDFDRAGTEVTAAVVLVLWPDVIEVQQAGGVSHQTGQEAAPVSLSHFRSEQTLSGAIRAGVVFVSKTESM
jgi:hypothetical protein